MFPSRIHTCKNGQLEKRNAYQIELRTYILFVIELDDEWKIIKK